MPYHNLLEIEPDSRRGLPVVPFEVEMRVDVQSDEDGQFERAEVPPRRVLDRLREEPDEKRLLGEIEVLRHLFFD